MNAKEFLVNTDIKILVNGEKVKLTPEDGLADLLEDYHKYKVENLGLFDVGNSLDLVELERKIDEALDNETSESLKEWLHSKRQRISQRMGLLR